MIFRGETFRVLLDTATITSAVKTRKLDAETGLTSFPGWGIHRYVLRFAPPVELGGVTDHPLPQTTSRRSVLAFYNWVRQVALTPKPHVECARECKAEGVQLAALATRLGYQDRLAVNLGRAYNPFYGSVGAGDPAISFVQEVTIPTWVPGMGKLARTLMPICGAAADTVDVTFATDAYLNAGLGYGFTQDDFNVELFADLVPPGLAKSSGKFLGFDYYRQNSAKVLPLWAGFRPHTALFFDPNQTSPDDPIDVDETQLDLEFLKRANSTEDCALKMTRMKVRDVLQQQFDGYSNTNSDIETWPTDPSGVVDYVTLRSIKGQDPSFAAMFSNPWRYLLNEFSEHTVHDCWVPVKPGASAEQVGRELAADARKEHVARGGDAKDVIVLRSDTDGAASGNGNPDAVQAAGVLVQTGGPEGTKASADATAAMIANAKAALQNKIVTKG